MGICPQATGWGAPLRVFQPHLVLHQRIAQAHPIWGSRFRPITSQNYKNNLT